MEPAKTRNNTVVKLTESAMMIAIAALLSVAKLIDMPYGGSVTLASMLPLVIIAYRHGLGWGVLTGLAYGAVQLALGTENFGYLPVKTFAGVVTLIVADYLAAFAVLGLGGIFRKLCRRQATALSLGALLVSILRYACHVVAGWTVWAGFVTTKAGLLYSLSYNGTYMLPETLIVVGAAAILGNILDFRGEGLRPLASEEKASPAVALSLGAGALLGFGLSFDVVQIFKKIQDPDTGEFVKASLEEVDWLLVCVVTAICVFAAAVLLIFAHKVKVREKAARAEETARKARLQADADRQEPSEP